MLLHLTTTQVAVEAEVIAAGLDVAALRGLAGLPLGFLGLPERVHQQAHRSGSCCSGWANG